MKLIDEVINLYLVRKRVKLKLAETQKALIVFKGQAVKEKLLSYNIELVAVPANDTLLSTARLDSKWISKEVHKETVYCLLQLSCETAT